jgi:hypothetical protein
MDKMLQLLMINKEHRITVEDLKHPRLDDLERDNSYIEKRVPEIAHNNYSNKIELQELLLRQAHNLDQIRIHYPERYPYPENTIFNAIMNKYRMKGVDSHTLKQIYDIFDFPEYDRYKNHIYNTAKRRMRAIQIDEEDSLGEKHVVDIKVFQATNFIEENIDHPIIQNFLRRKEKEMQKLETKQRKEKEELDKETIPRPDFIPEGTQGTESLLYNAIMKHIDTWKDIAVRVYQFPPRDPQDDQWYAEGIETLTALLVPGTDLKYVRDTLSYFDISYEKNTQSIHSAMSKSKILTPSNKWRKVTREQIADIDPQIILLALHTIEKIPGLIHFFIYLMNEQKPYSGEFHLNRHDKLSESAFGKSSMMD